MNNVKKKTIFRLLHSKFCNLEEILLQKLTTEVLETPTVQFQNNFTKKK